MGLFKNKEPRRPTLPMGFSNSPPPRFPSFDDSDIQFPKYEPTLNYSPQTEIKRAIETPSFEQTKPLLKEEKAIFVQIENYKAALSTLDSIKEKIKTAEIILNELNQIKQKEDAEHSEWQNNINEIKRKLSLVDQNLFEI